MSKRAKKKPIVVSVINLKGGVGKTTVAALLARHAAEKGLNVLAVDLDPQSNLSQALMTENEYQAFMKNKEASIVELLNGYNPPSSTQPAPTPLNVNDILKQVDHSTSYKHEDNFHLIPSRFDFSDNLIAAIQPDIHALARFIAQEMQEKELILVDCAPTESIITRTAYHASRYILVPVRPEFFSTIGFPLLNESLEKFRSENPKHTIDVCGILINNSETRGIYPGPQSRTGREEIQEQAQQYGWPIMKREMTFSRGYLNWMLYGDPGYNTNAIGEFPRIANEFLGMMGL